MSARRVRSVMSASLSTFIGRTRETAELLDLMEGRRLVTLVGPGGTGKTRLALELAQQLCDQQGAVVALVDVAEAGSRAVDSAAAAAFELADDPDLDAIGLLERAFSSRAAVLVLDNVESLPKHGRTLVARMARQVPGLRVIGTGRTPMHVEGEQEYSVQPLEVPPDDAAPAVIVAFEAVRLFVDRAKLVDRRFGIDESIAGRVAAICRRLDGLPLAIELAAARLKLVSLVDLEASLDDALSLPASDDRPQRQRTLGDTIAWSVRQLDPPSRTLLGRLAVFSGSFDLAAVRALAPDEPRTAVEDALFALVDRSLVTTVPGDGPRRYALLDTIRQFAVDRLTLDTETAGRHAGHYADVAEAAVVGVTGSDALPADRANFAAALEWAAGHDDRLLGRLAVALATFWRDHGDPGQGRDWLMRALERREGMDPPTVAHALEQLSRVQMALGEWPASERSGREALRLFDALGDPRGSVRVHGMLGSLGSVTRGSAAAGEVQEELEAAVRKARQLGDPRLLIDTLGALGAGRRSDHANAERAFSEALELARQIDDKKLIARLLTNLGWVSLMLRRPEVAVDRTREGANLLAGLGDARNEAWARLNLANACHALGRREEAVEAVRRAITLTEAVGSAPEEAEALETGAALQESAGDHPGAVASRAAAEGIRQARRMGRPPDEQSIWDRALARLRQRLGPDAYRSAWDLGRRLTAPAALARLREALDATVADGTSPIDAGGLVDGHPRLTSRELDVLGLVGRGLSDAEISETLGISPKTASVHVSNIKRKLGVDTRLQVALRARGED